MELIIADANIFVYLFKCNLLERFLSNTLYEIAVTQEVFDELTDSKRRITRGYPELRNRIITARHNKTASITINVININELELSNESLRCYYYLEDEGELDAGEIESIPLALEKGARFLSNDDDAINAANTMKQGLGILFNEFCNEMLSHELITEEELQGILEIIQ